MPLPDISYREVRSEDREFLRTLREITMRAVVERHRPWDEAEQEIRLQASLDDALIIQTGGQDIGLLKIIRRDHHIELSQLQLLPAWQGLGIGSKIIQDLQVEAAAAARPLVLHTFASNRALALFTRLGFAQAASSAHFRGLRWTA